MIRAQLRSTIGILECWNDGKMGSGKTGSWFIEKISLHLEVNNFKR
jgi:hypothetical protein